ncbi:MAG: hypothetical protein COB73_05640 [Flavobacteriaceae bacterium]|nr:MAG: hypothetical protein COB73_05640 [Flavobacteriaceae bacterium]
MKKPTTYKFIDTNSIFKIVVAFCFLLFLISKPLLQRTIYADDLKVEIVDTTEKENSTSDNEIDLEDETEDFLFQTPSFQRYGELVFLYYKQNNSFINYQLDINLPPPRV